ncbi:hypothetical protein BT96DRAFT_977948 [Gymnopus androsaceus JB14]|uniref:Uncharacterized protein n=1 Tax=Gymnopus androsaceus JB14 TaxID=1447944 RepID=A0A6A4HCV5_9AGAR|nr:hypothetical protein BT96DRAFT_977948 [Gymnopus androsaceus JB14]
MPPKWTSEAVASVNDMAKEAIAESISRCPSAANFFHNMTPETIATSLKKKKKNKQSNDDTENEASKRTKYDISSDEDGDNDNNDDDEDSENASVAPGKGKAKVKKEEYREYPPFVLRSSAPYSSLVVAIAEKLPCSVLSVPESEIKWRKPIPKTGTPVLMGGNTGYCSALIPKLLTSKVGQKEVMLYMPKPVAEKLDSRFDYDLLKDNFLDVASTSNAIAAQQEAFDDRVQNEIALLKAKYPIGTHPLYPDKRIYTQPTTGALFELTHIKLSSWANHMSQGTATVDAPPAVSHFDFAQRIKRVPSASAMLSTSAPVFASTSAAPVAAAPSAITNAFGGVSLTDLLALKMLQDFSLPTTGIFGQLATPPPPASLPSAPSSPTRTIESVDVPLDVFCTHYKLSEDDFSKLTLLGYIPGDTNISKLGPDMWQTFAGFAPLTWNRILDVHKHFLADVRRGNWSHVARSTPHI